MVLETCEDGSKDTHCCDMRIKEPFTGRDAPEMTVSTQRTAAREKAVHARFSQ